MLATADAVPAFANVSPTVFLTAFASLVFSALLAIVSGTPIAGGRLPTTDVLPTLSLCGFWSCPAVSRFARCPSKSDAPCMSPFALSAAACFLSSSPLMFDAPTIFVMIFFLNISRSIARARLSISFVKFGSFGWSGISISTVLPAISTSTRVGLGLGFCFESCPDAANDASWLFNISL